MQQNVRPREKKMRSSRTTGLSQHMAKSASGGWCAGRVMRSLLASINGRRGLSHAAADLEPREIGVLPSTPADAWKEALALPVCIRLSRLRERYACCDRWLSPTEAMWTLPTNFTGDGSVNHSTKRLTF